ncbi:MAG: hypothetical protein A3J49_04105 [Gallionellales bacterium RIFCSPHIGHO2_02_FULL_57_16]|nr:MAG: hypothetical protein A3J49_04105 [Gallionellales bacterium RIFCSPHIGHO2_02_FULL_57_16]
MFCMILKKTVVRRLRRLTQLNHLAGMTAGRTHMAKAGRVNNVFKICGNLRNLRMQSPFFV